MTDRDANNRKLAEWLEPAPKIDRQKRNLLGRYICGPWDIGEWDKKWSVRFDFYTSEDASAMLREKLRRLDCQIMMDREGVTVYGPYPDSQSRRPTLVRNQPETLTAIAQAALALIEAKRSNV